MKIKERETVLIILIYSIIILLLVFVSKKDCSFIPEDVNRDERVDAADLLRVQKYILENDKCD